MIRRAYSPYVSGEALRQVLASERPGEIRGAEVLVMALRSGRIIAPEPQAPPRAAAESLRIYREEAGALLKKAGAAITGCDGDLILAAFGAPLGSVRHGKQERTDPLDRALLLALELLRNPRINREWRFGLDIGECAFSYTEISGYSALGPPVVSARLLSALARRRETPFLASCRVKSRLESMAPVLNPPPEFKKLDVMVERESGREEEFFSLTFAG
jgi:class 3 adenylate cyclase